MVEPTKYSLDDFQLYQAARDFRREVYRLIKLLPAEERYAAGEQMRRAVLSITNNIAEGHGHWHHQETIRFYLLARASLSEVLDDINLCLDEGYGDQEQNLALKGAGYQLAAKINGYVSYLRSQQASRTRSRSATE